MICGSSAECAPEDEVLQSECVSLTSHLSQISRGVYPLGEPVRGIFMSKFFVCVLFGCHESIVPCPSQEWKDILNIFQRGLLLARHLRPVRLSF